MSLSGVASAEADLFARNVVQKLNASPAWSDSITDRFHMVYQSTSTVAKLVSLPRSKLTHLALPKMQSETRGSP